MIQFITANAGHLRNLAVYTVTNPPWCPFINESFRDCKNETLCTRYETNKALKCLDNITSLDPYNCDSIGYNIVKYVDECFPKCQSIVEERFFNMTYNMSKIIEYECEITIGKILMDVIPTDPPGPVRKITDAEMALIITFTSIAACIFVCCCLRCCFRA